MKRNVRQTRFRDDLRRLLLFYGLVPLLAAVLLLFSVLGYIPLKNVIHGTGDDLLVVQKTFQQQWDSLQNMLFLLQWELDLEAFQQNIRYQASVKEKVYQYINQTNARPIFFLLDEKEQLVFSTQTDQSLRTSLQSGFHWRLTKNLPQEKERISAAVVRSTVGFADLSHLMMGCRLLGAEGETEGYLFFAVEETPMLALFQRLNSTILVTDRFDSAFLGTSSTFIGDFGKLRADLRENSGFALLPEGLFYLRSCTAAHDFLRIYALSSCGDILSTLALLGGLVLVFFGAFTAIILLSTESVAAQKTRMIDEIAAACYQVQQGDLNTELSISSHDEFQIIAQAYNSMLSSMRKLIERSVELGHETAVSRIKQLESQFNPHFLFNTLENVRFMIRMDPKGADKALVQLSSLLRYSIEPSGMMIPLKDDLDYIRSYLQILELRFGERLHYQIDVPQELEQFPVPKLIAQPMIENAIRYGMKKRGTLNVVLSACREGEQVILRITDDGQGIEAETLQAILSSLDNPEKDRSGHLGILNVHERIRLMYGDPYGVTIETKPEKGTVVSLHFPGDGRTGGYQN